MKGLRGVNIKRGLLALVAAVIVLGFGAGFALGNGKTRTIAGFPIAARYIMGNAGIIRAQVLDPGESGLGDIIDNLEKPEVLMEMDDERSALLMPGDQFIVYCQITGFDRTLRIHACRMIPVVNRE